MEPIEVQLHETAKERYLNYAMSVITSRALPDVRDGMKPVQRRILYAMFANLRLTHDAKPRKSAAVVGEVMAKLHPHGDSSIYDAMVRMAQSFSLRYPLVDGHGNFGSIDGDNAAAMRYTEARLTPLASELLTEIRRNTVDFRPNYDSTMDEPIVLPAQVPNLLINGATGIAVGMATNIPPHNIAEVLDGLDILIQNRDAEISELVRTIQGPDFPTGGVLLESQDEIQKIYEEGSGSVTIQANWEIESEAGRRAIIIKSVPYTVNKSTLVEKIASHVIANKLPQIVDVRDESSDEIRVVLELKRGADAEAAMAYLFKHTPLQSRFHINLTCLVPTDNPQVPAPARLNLKEMLVHFLDFRLEVVTRRLQHDLAQLLRRIHILEGFEIVFNDLDAAIRIIRNSDGKADASRGLISYFGIDEEQADAVLETKLYRLAKIEIGAIMAELEEKRTEAARIQALLDDEGARWALIRQELADIRSAYADARRTQVSAEVKVLEYSEEMYIVNESAWVIVTREGWVKRQKSYSDLSAIRVRENDEVRWVMPGRTRETAMFFTSHGRVYTQRIADIISTTGYGDPIQGTFDFEDGERIVGVLTHDKRVVVKSFIEPEQTSLVEEPQEAEEVIQMVAITAKGQSLRFSIEGFLEPSTVKGRRYIRLSDKDGVVNVEMTDGTETVAIASRNGRGLMFPVTDISYFKNAAKGVKAMSLEKTDEILDFTLCRKHLDGLEVETNRGARVWIRATKSKFEPTSRGNKGKVIIHRGHLIRSHRAPVEIRTTEEEEVEVEQPQ
jgi:DNA gyrase subunit A